MTTHPDRPMNDDEKIVRESIIHGKTWCIETEAAFDRLMAIAPHGEMKSAEEWADMLAMKGLERNDMRNVVISIQQDAIASRTATGGGAIKYADILERERTVVADAVTHIRKAIGAHEWLRLGRGSYEYDDDRWKDEFGMAIDAIIAAFEPLKSIASDWTNCPEKWPDIQSARKPLSAAPTHDAVSQELITYHRMAENGVWIPTDEYAELCALRRSCVVEKKA